MFHKPLTIITSTINQFFQLKGIQQLQKKYPRLVKFIHDRLDMQNFLGLPLTLLLGIGLINYALLSEISESLVNSQSMKQVDSSVGLFLYHLRTDAVAQAFYYFTELGTTLGVAITCLLVAAVLLYKRRWHYLASLLIAVLGTGTSIYFTKLYFHRERPLDIGYYKPSSFSFPSGHSAEALALFGIIAVFILLERQHIRYARFWAGVCVAYILLIGFSRIFLGVHFVSDVAGGYLLGSLWLILAVCVLEYLLLHFPHSKRQPSR
ncbi:phosphatase PAP2 family protein [Pontibacter chitinilyticus]|uniref:phosphatase PAP2 family protein n=1 Tax=Pontibacter chitinilyticus TaxID=2674989 RepID=UPI00321A3BCC